jgi:hypothetical protein
MITAAQAIADLDAALKRNGEDVVLRRQLPGRDPIDVTCRARVNRIVNPESAPGPKVALFEVFISPTQITAAGWPGNNFVEPESIDQRIPRENGPDKVLMRGENPRTVTICDPKVIDGTLVRLNLRISG